MAALLLAMLLALSAPAPVTAAVGAGPELDPVLIIPGLGGSRLYANLNHTHTPHWYCTDEQAAALLWLDASELAVFDCLIFNLRLEWDSGFHHASDAPGADVYTCDVGPSFECVDTLSAELGTQDASEYLLKFHQQMTAAGYTTKNLAAAPYDWRLPPWALSEWMASVEAQIEAMAAEAGGKPVHVLAHSLGATVAAYWLAAADPAWKAKYVADYISLGGPYGGAPTLIKALVNGQNSFFKFFNISLVPQDKFKALVVSFGSMPWLAPTVSINDSCIVRGPDGQCFSTHNLGPLLDAAHADPAAAIYAAIPTQLQPDHFDPGVPSYCFVGTQVPTEASYDWSGLDWSDSPLTAHTSGDGTVPLSSTQLCRTWADVTFKEFPGTIHADLPTSPVVIQSILSITTS